MDNDRQQGETSTVRTHDRGEVSGKPIDGGTDDDATTEAPIRKQADATIEQETGSQRPRR